jgi:hypothetical protein
VFEQPLDTKELLAILITLTIATPVHRFQETNFNALHANHVELDLRSMQQQELAEHQDQFANAMKSMTAQAIYVLDAKLTKYLEIQEASKIENVKIML